MPRQKTYPRYDGRLELHRTTYGEIDMTTIPKEGMNVLSAALDGFVRTCEQWFWIETGFSLKIIAVKDGDEDVWTVDDDRSASMAYHWLSSKAAKYSSKIVDRLNQLVKEGMCYPKKEIKSSSVSSKKRENPA